MSAWGNQTWGFQNWGTLGNLDVTLSSTNLQSTFSIGSITVDNEIQVGWGGDTYGENEWGDICRAPAGALQISFLFEATGLSSSISAGSTTIGIGVPVTGISATTSAGAATVDESELTGIGWGRRTWGNLSWGEAFSVAVTGQQLTSSIGTAVGKTDVTVSVTSAGQLSSTTNCRRC